MENLPIDILEIIFSYLSSISSLRCKIVCKTWGSVIGKSKSKVGFLVALRRKNEKEVQLFSLRRKNEKEVQVKLERYDYSEKLRDPVGGFGYVESTNEYKVVRIYYDPVYRKTHTHVYTLGSQVGWRIISDEIPYIFRSSGIFANGAIHFLHESQRCRSIVAFDLADERFKSVPALPHQYDYVPATLSLLGGNLCVVFRNQYPHTIDIWAFKKKVDDNKVFLPVKIMMMRQDYDWTWSWNKEFTIACECPASYNPFAITDKNQVLLWHKDTNTHSESIYCYEYYNHFTSTLNKCSDAYSETFGSCHQIIPHMNTLVSLKELGEPLGNDGSSAHKKRSQ